MSRTSRRVSVVVAVLLIAFLSSAALAESMIDRVRETGVLRMGWGIWYPYCYIEGWVDDEDEAVAGEPQGLSIDLAKNLASEMGVELELVQGDWGTLIMGIKADKYDLWMNLAVTLPRALEIGYTQPLLIDPVQNITTREWWEAHKDEIDSLDDLDSEKYTITAGLGTNNDTFVSQTMKNVNILRVKDTPTGIMAVRAGQADFTSHTAAGVKRLIEDNPDLIGIPSAETIPGEYPGYPVCFAVQRDDVEAINFLNLWIDKLYRFGTLQLLVEKWGLPLEMLAK